MEMSLKLKWLGGETEEICRLLAPFKPLILISPTPQLQKAPPGLTPLPGGVSKIWDLRGPDGMRLPAGTADANEGKFRFEFLELGHARQDFSAVYEFYFQTYLRNYAVRSLEGTTPYEYMERLHEALLEGKFVAFIRAFSGDEVVAGCLLKRLPGDEQLDCLESLEPPPAGEGARGVALGLACTDVRFERDGINDLLIFHAARWAREAGYSFISTAPSFPLVVNPVKDSAGWACGGEAIPVLHKKNTALLYCDLRRCSYLQQDFYYYSCEGAAPRLHYVANVGPRSSRAAALLNSITGIEKRAYTRHAPVHDMLSAAGITCEFVGRAGAAHR